MGNVITEFPSDQCQDPISCCIHNQFLVSRQANSSGVISMRWIGRQCLVHSRLSMGRSPSAPFDGSKLMQCAVTGVRRSGTRNSRSIRRVPKSCTEILGKTLMWFEILIPITCQETPWSWSVIPKTIVCLCWVDQNANPLACSALWLAGCYCRKNGPSAVICSIAACFLQVIPHCHT